MTNSRDYKEPSSDPHANIGVGEINYIIISK